MDQGFPGLVRRGWDLHAVSLINPQSQRNAPFGLWSVFNRTGTVDSLLSSIRQREGLLCFRVTQSRSIKNIHHGIQLIQYSSFECDRESFRGNEGRYDSDSVS
jgi:hypothetical protein